jgi:hypothetical protein
MYFVGFQILTNFLHLSLVHIVRVILPVQDHTDNKPCHIQQVFLYCKNIFPYSLPLYFENT